MIRIGRARAPPDWPGGCSRHSRPRRVRGGTAGVPDILIPPREEFSMAKIMAFFVVLASFLLVAPVIESGTSEPRQHLPRGRQRRRRRLVSPESKPRPEAPGPARPAGENGGPLGSPPRHRRLPVPRRRRYRSASRGEPRGPVDGGAYRRPLGNDPATLDPARIADVYSRSVAQQIFDGLVQFDQTLTVTPGAGAVLEGVAGRPDLDVHAAQGRPVPPRARGDGGRRRLLADPHPRSRGSSRRGVDLFLTIQGAQEFREGRAASGRRARRARTRTRCRSR